MKDTLEKEQIERDYQNTLVSFISETLQTLRDFTLDRWKSIFTSDEENKVCYGILAMSEKKGLDVTAKASLDSAPDFINAPPKLRFAVRWVEKWLDSEVFLCQKEGFREESTILG